MHSFQKSYIFRSVPLCITILDDSYDLIYCYVNLKRKGVETALLDPVPTATYACQYLAVAKMAAWRGSGHTRIITYT